VLTEHETDFPHFAPEGNPDKALNGGCDRIDLHPQYLFETLTCSNDILERLLSSLLFFYEVFSCVYEVLQAGYCTRDTPSKWWLKTLKVAFGLVIRQKCAIMTRCFSGAVSQGLG